MKLPVHISVVGKSRRRRLPPLPGEDIRSDPVSVECMIFHEIRVVPRRTAVVFRLLQNLQSRKIFLCLYIKNRNQREILMETESGGKQNDDTIQVQTSVLHAAGEMYEMGGERICG